MVIFESEAVREARIRRAAKRQGYILRKSRRRDKGAPDFALYGLWAGRRAVNPSLAVIRSPYSWTLDQVEQFLAGPTEDAPQPRSVAEMLGAAAARSLENLPVYTSLAPSKGSK
jgi:hypothetical protein